MAHDTFPPELTPELLLRAYAAGVFPMSDARDDPDLFWVDPRRRGILPLDRFHISRSLARTLRRDRFHASLNADFAGVVKGCADREETWISHQIEALYTDLHHRGAAHSLEIWDDDALVGGVYGVTLGAAFFGESMFSRRTDASKVALAYLVDHLNRTGFRLFDTQFITPHLASLGGQDISRAAYRARLAQALEHDADIAAAPLAASGQAVIQRNTQMSYRE